MPRLDMQPHGEAAATLDAAEIRAQKSFLVAAADACVSRPQRSIWLLQHQLLYNHRQVIIIIKLRLDKQQLKGSDCPQSTMVAAGDMVGQ